MIGRKLYYDITSGNEVLIIPQQNNSNAILSSTEQDFIMIDVLQARNPLQVGVIQFEYGEMQGDFSQCNSVRVDLETLQPIFEFPIRVVSQSEQISALETENIELKAKNVTLQENTNINKTTIEMIMLEILPSMMV